MDHFEHKLLQGQGAGKWLPFARTKVAALHARAKAMRVTALVQRWTVEGGDVEVAVRVVGDQRYIHIRRKSCPVFASGLADGILNPIFAVSPLVPLKPLIETTVEGDPGHPQYAFQRFFPSVRDAAALDVPREFRNDPRLARNLLATAQLISSDGASRSFLKSGQFSSEMRKVVQVLQGMNEFAPYSPLYANTHGVFVSADGIRWVVEISVNGVVAWVMNVCTAQPVTAENGDVLLPYTPLPSPKPTGENLLAAIAAGTYKILCDNTTVLDFYTKAPFFPHCGWAFSGDGHQSANVCYYYEGFTPRSSLYTITITEVDNAPSAATMSRSEDGYLFGTKAVHMKYPKPGGKLYSFDTTGPVPVVSNAPVYCWYEGNNLIVARYEFSPGGSTQIVDDGNPGNLPCDGDLGRDLLNGSFTFIPVPTLSISGNTTPAQRVNFGGNIRNYHKGSIAGGELLNFTVGDGEFREFFDATLVVRAGVVSGQDVRATLIVPYAEREAAYIAIEQTNTLQSGTIDILHRYTTSGESYFSECSEPCAGVPTRCVELIAGIGGQASPPEQCTTGAGTAWFFGGGTFIPGAGIGSVLRAAEQDGAGCAQIPLNETAEPSPDVSIPSTDTVSRDYTFRFIGSGGVSDSLPLPPVPATLVAFIDEQETQRAVAIRDAFNGSRYVISSNTASDGGDPTIVQDDAGYPLKETLGEPCWVGVP